MVHRGGKPVLQIEANEEHLRGVHRLAGAVLVQAIEDIRSGSGRKREDAVRWVTDSSEEQFSFIFCCRILNRNPEEVRRMLVRQALPAWLFPNPNGDSETQAAAEV